jgi:hypothetical protein
MNLARRDGSRRWAQKCWRTKISTGVAKCCKSVAPIDQCPAPSVAAQAYDPVRERQAKMQQFGWRRCHDLASVEPSGRRGRELRRLGRRPVTRVSARQTDASVLAPLSGGDAPYSHSSPTFFLFSTPHSMRAPWTMKVWGISAIWRINFFQSTTDFCNLYATVPLRIGGTATESPRYGVKAVARGSHRETCRYGHLHVWGVPCRSAQSPL